MNGECHTGLRLFGWCGTDVWMHPSWLFTLAILVWSLARLQLPADSSAHPTIRNWTVAATSGLLIMVSVLLHELAHVGVARLRKVQVLGVVLHGLGGTTCLVDEDPSARTGFYIAIAGPLTNALLAVAFGVGAAAGAGDYRAASVLRWVAYANGSLAGLNLIPAASLDGALALRATVACRSKP